MRIQDILTKKKNQQKMTMLTAYNFFLGGVLDSADIDIILVGDSLANVELGLEKTAHADMQMMLHHLAAVRRAVSKALLTVDMPYGSFHQTAQASLDNAQKFIAAGADAVKVEWHESVLENISLFKAHKIEFIGHVGLTPQTAESMKVQGRGEDAVKILEQAAAFERSGAFALVLECVPETLAKEITQRLIIPTFGIGAGKYCDGQVLVTYDMLGMYERFTPKFVKQYAQLGRAAVEAVKKFKTEVENGAFPAAEHSFK